MNTARNSSNSSRYANTGYGPAFSVLDIGLKDRVAVIEPDSGFWALAASDALEDALSGELLGGFLEKATSFHEEMETLRFGLKPSAVYFNPTERCNLNCSYCYLPETMRREGKTMTAEELGRSLDKLLIYFREIQPPGVRPQLIFHGSEPLLAKDAVFPGIERFSEDFVFGIQTNATLLDDEAIEFFKKHRVGIGISLDGPDAGVADATRKNWRGTGCYGQVTKVLEKLASYPAFNVITTVTSANVHTLPAMVDFLHSHGVRVAMFNPVRCTQEGGLRLKPANDVMAEFFLQALDRTHEHFERTGQKLILANFANILAGIVGPTMRRLMCDISPCGGGRCFFAVSATGDVFPCSEFIGFSEFNGGNLNREELSRIVASKPFQEVTGRKVEAFLPCAGCAIRHFCGAPCPAEVKIVSGTLNAPSPYCQFYEEVVRYAFRVIASEREDAYLWDGWQEETDESFSWV
jgi:uncharacterized protein